MIRSPFRIGFLAAFIVLFSVFASPAQALTYTKNSFPTSSGQVIACDGNDIRISCEDSGDGRNHFCSTFGINGCRAVEGRNNFGSPGCLITCQKEDRCSDGTASGQCSATNPFYCDAGILVKRASFCGCVKPKIRSGDDCVAQPSQIQQPQVQQPQVCSDNTPFNQCSSNRSLFCLGGSLINRALSCGCPSGQTSSGDNCIAIQTLQTCTDGTLFGQCSPTRPLFCNNGVLINRASLCGCVSGQVASGDNCIAQQQTCTDGTFFGQCSATKPLFCNNGVLINRATACGCPSGQTSSGDNCVPIVSSQQVSNKLVITDIDAKVDGKSSSNIGDNGEISKEAKPDSNIELEIEVRNTFTAAENIDIEDIEVRAAIESIENGNDIEEESESFDLRADADKTVRFKFKVPLNVEEGTYNIFIEAEGEDENGNGHNDDADIELEVEKEKHDLRFSSFDLSPKTVSCSRELNANARIINLGEEDEDAFIEIKSDDLGLNLRNPIDIKSDIDDNAATKNLRLTIGNSVKEGTYSLSANAYSEDGTIRDRRLTEITVENCGAGLQQGDGVILQISSPPQAKKEQIIAPLFDFDFSGLDPKITILLLAILIIILFILIIIFAAASGKETDDEQYY